MTNDIHNFDWLCSIDILLMRFDILLYLRWHNFRNGLKGGDFSRKHERARLRESPPQNLVSNNTAISLVLKLLLVVRTKFSLDTHYPFQYNNPVG